MKKTIKPLKIFIVALSVICCASCGPSSPKDFSEEIQECYGNAAISDMAGKPEEAKKYKDKARSLDIKARAKFEKDAAKLAEYNIEMRNFKID